MPYFDHRDARIFFDVHGVGEPALVFVHGFGCAHVDWLAQLAHFAPARKVVVLDLRGHGASSAPSDACGLEACAEDVAALVEALGLARAVLVGHSLGCRVVLQAYLRAVERVVGIALLDGSALGGDDPDAEETMRAYIESLGYAQFARELYGEALLPDTAQGRAIFARAVQLQPSVGACLFPSMVGWDARGMVSALDAAAVPLLAVQSTYLNAQRRRVRLRSSESSPWLDLVRAHAPHAQIEIVEGPGHFLMLEAPEQVNRLLDRFLGELMKE